jgi:hypothetical protein
VPAEHRADIERSSSGARLGVALGQRRSAPLASAARS